MHVFRVFDALNDIRNVVDTAEAVNECGGHFEGAISYTISPVHTLDSYLEYAQQLKELGADSICVKDMAGLMTPYRAERIVKALNAEIGLPVHLHCHYVGGMAPANYLKAAEAGVSIVDTASAPLAFGNSQPAVEMIVAALPGKPLRPPALTWTCSSRSPNTGRKCASAATTSAACPRLSICRCTRIRCPAE